MSSTRRTGRRGWTSDVVEDCATCECETRHAVTVELRTENPDSENATFSREPYRVAECDDCGATEEVRLNNA